MKSLNVLAAAGSIAALLATGSAAQTTLTAETTIPGQIPHTMIAALGEYAAAEGIAALQIAEGQTGTNILKNVAEGKTDVGSVPFLLVFLMEKGAGPYGTIGAEEGAKLAANLQILVPYNFAVHYMFAYDSSPVKSWDDLAGVRVLNGPPRGNALSGARAIIKVVTGLDDGEGYDGVQLNWGQMTSAIAANSADVMVLPLAMPDPIVTASLAAGNMTLWGIPKDAWESEGMQRYLSSPGKAPFVRNRSEFVEQEGLTLASDTDGTLRGIATPGGNIVHKDMPFELAKALTAALISNIDNINSKTASMNSASLGIIDAEQTGLCGPIQIRYHPGAVAAWEEAGYEIPDCAKP